MNDSKLVLTQHRLRHIPELKIDPILFTASFLKDASMFKCNATCCKDGVYADIEERDQILAQADMIKKYLDPNSEHDHNKWFEKEVCDDLDFPSGKCVGTNANEHGCVLLRSDGACALQLATTTESGKPFALKPYYCVAFPITIVEGVLTLDEPDFANREMCCSYVENGDLKAIDLCSLELNYMLGERGFEELKKIAETQSAK